MRRNDFFVVTVAVVVVVAVVVGGVGVKFPVRPDEPETKSGWSDAARKTIERIKARVPNLSRARNTIMFLGDGMGVSTLTAARVLKGQRNGNSGPEESLVWDEFPGLALVKTYNVDKTVPDSAGTATAYLTGAKASYGVIGFDERVRRTDCAGQRREYETESFLSVGARDGRSVGVVTTARLTHASPSAVYAHASERKWEAVAPDGCEDIADQLANGDHGVDVFFGGGLRNMFDANFSLPGIHNRSRGYRRDGRNLVEEWRIKQKAKGKAATVALDKEEFDAIDVEKTDAVLGMFASGHMSWDELRDPELEPSLEEMTTKTIQILEKNKNGFLLFVEGGRIDHGHHDGMAKAALTECVAMDRALSRAMRMTDPSETLFVVTADHSHTFAFGGYPLRGASIFDVNEENAKDGLTYTPLLYANGPGHRVKRINVTNEKANEFFFTQDSAVPLKDETHGGEDVAVFASGPHAHLFSGVIDQSAIPHIIAYAACIRGFGSEDLLGNATHCVFSDPKIFASNSVVIGIVVGIVVLVVVVIFVSYLVKRKRGETGCGGRKGTGMTEFGQVSWQRKEEDRAVLS